MVCRVADLFADDAIGVPDSETFEAIKTVIKSTAGIAYAILYDEAINAIGRGNFDNIAKMAAGNVDSVCECFDPDAIPPDATAPDATTGWYMSPNMVDQLITQTGDNGGNLYSYLAGHIEEHDVFAVFMVIEASPDINDFKSVDVSTMEAIITGFPSSSINVAGFGGHLEDLNTAYPIIQISNPAIGAVVAAQRGFSTAVYKTGGVDGVNTISAPNWPAGQTGGFCVTPARQTFMEPS